MAVRLKREKEVQTGRGVNSQTKEMMNSRGCKVVGMARTEPTYSSPARLVPVPREQGQGWGV